MAAYLLVQARSRIAKAHYPVLGTGLPPPPPAAVAASERRIAMEEAAEWLCGAGWEACGMEAALPSFRAGRAIPGGRLCQPALRVRVAGPRGLGAAPGLYSCRGGQGLAQVPAVAREAAARRPQPWSRWTRREASQGSVRSALECTRRVHANAHAKKL